MALRKVMGLSVAAVAALGCIIALSMMWTRDKALGETELLLKSNLRAHEPYSPPSNMYLWWGDTTNHRAPSSGEHIRHLLQMVRLFNNTNLFSLKTACLPTFCHWGVYAFRGIVFLACTPTKPALAVIRTHASRFVDRESSRGGLFLLC